MIRLTNEEFQAFLDLYWAAKWVLKGPEWRKLLTEAIEKAKPYAELQQNDVASEKP